jgi:hypothetical protein
VIEANKNKLKDFHTLLKEYQHHEQIFLETGAEMFPPS